MPKLLTLKWIERSVTTVAYTTLQRVGNAVRHTRLSQDLTQEELAELIGTSYTYISSLERGQRNVTIQTLDRIAQACRTDLFRMLQLDGPEDETIIEMLALLMSRDPLDRKKVLNIAREMFRSQ
ncbi:helix-turn-helix domain-containing protein [Aneurinibacillus aneurinilyticus]|uniref:DNA-binding helix-turn-helix protein n=1 Tax=Aneurinibacillus aneurinilyticus ATCC 12856 TaxID=649747 RepID=U1Y946_ANEAE|nr:helix-turn-helix transcriptional regulator [Aneurinibacillus aneurinilyticus]ERI07331.1 DNA-binding helix-turn-helix protein [Aneurinibacillus aneurinilyticus ATCC 12856]MED0709694.1 helix-turn-helix transcriptional regulator [Aneurinibacillus aneurinilyticus]MED0734926.1 helix-turn-helix transcriptional regulator [Aneurinibacillus aneurinilyticus]